MQSRRASAVDSPLHEVNADLPIVAPHNATTTAEQQRELIGDIVIARHGELCAVRGNVPDYAAQRRRPAVNIDLSEIMNFESRSLAQFAKRVPRLKEPHLVLLPWPKHTHRQCLQAVNDSSRHPLNLLRLLLMK